MNSICAVLFTLCENVHKLYVCFCRYTLSSHPNFPAQYKLHSIPFSSLAALRWRRKVSLIIGDKSNNKRIRQSFLASLVFMERTRTPQIQRSGCLHLQISTAKFCVFSICSFRYFSIEHADY